MMLTTHASLVPSPFIATLSNTSPRAKKNLPLSKTIPVSNGFILDTHEAVWLMSGEQLRNDAEKVISIAQAESRLFLSAISAWESGSAALKNNAEKRPNLLGLPADAWFQYALRALPARVVQITQRIAIETATVPAIYGSADPGDCFLIATARIRNLTLITRDEKILALSRRDPAYLSVIAC